MLFAVYWRRGHSESLKMAPFESLGTDYYSSSIVTIAVSSIVLETKQDIGRKSRFFYPPLHLTTPRLGGCRQNINVPFSTLKLEWSGYLTVKKVWVCLKRFWQNTGVWWTDRHTDRQTSYDGIVRAMHSRRAVEINSVIRCVLKKPRVSRFAVWIRKRAASSVLNFIFKRSTF